MVTIDEAAEFIRWLEGDLLLCKELAARVPARDQATWATGVLTVGRAADIGDCSADLIDLAIEVGSDPERWAEGHDVFDALRLRTLEEERRGRWDSPCTALLLLAEVVAKVVYNASGRPAPFDRDSGAWVAKNARSLALALGDDDLAAHLWSALI